MSRPATRVLALLEVLQSRGLVGAGELADRLGIDARTVRRYAAALQELGVPVESVRGRYGGYRLAAGYRMPPLMLADDGAVAVAAALAAAGDGTAAAGPSPADRALVKLTRVMPPALRRRVAALIESTAVAGGGRAPLTPDPEVVLTLGGAVRAGRRVRIDYTRRDGTRGPREVDPFGLVVQSRRWYLVGHDHRRGEIRLFRVDRVAAAAELPHRCAAPAGFDPLEHALRALAFGPWTHRTEVWFDAEPDAVRARLPRTAGDVHPDPAGGTVLESGVEDLPGMARMLSGQPWRFTVRHPPALAEAVAVHAAELARAAARSAEAVSRLP